MSTRRRYSPIVGLLGLTTLLWFAAQAPSWGDEQPQQKQITELEKRIEDEAKRLEDMRKQLEDLRKQKNGETAGNAIPEAWVKGLNWRCIGPANMSGRITAISVYEADPSTFWIATASGGLLKTTNNGVTWKAIFDAQPNISIGALAIAPSDPNLLYVGTGEGNPRNSASFGEGMF